jgi:hypothetical protein
VNLFHQSHEIFGSVDMLVHTFQRLARNRFESDAQHRASAFGREFKHAVVLRKFGGNAGLPLNAAAPQGAHYLLGTFRRAEKIRIVHRDGARAAILHLVDDFVDRTITELETVHQWFGAKCAALMAAA